MIWRVLRLLGGRFWTIGPTPDAALMAGAAAMLSHHTFRNESPASCPNPIP